MNRIYLDWNATTPLRLEARAAMIAAMEVVGNPSSVHAEGRAAKALMERSRRKIASALGAEGADIVFTSGATEAAALACAGRGLVCAQVEHEAVSAWCEAALSVDSEGRVTVLDPSRTALQLANSETGVVQDLPQGLAVSDLTQGFGKLPLAFNWLGCEMGLVSAHKLGGPKGIGALVLRQGLDYLQSMNQNAKHCWVAGFSFGAWIGMQLLMRRPEITGFISVAPPANLYDFSFLAPCPASGLIINGTADKVAPPKDTTNLVNKLHEQKGITITHTQIEGADHFFKDEEAHMKPMIDTVSGYVKRRLTEVTR